MIKAQLQTLFSTTLFKILTVYVGFGILMTIMKYQGLTYDSIFHLTLTDKYLLAIFVFPTLLAFTVKMYEINTTNYCLVLKCKNRKSFLRQQIKSLFFLVLYCFSIFMLLILILTNLSLHRGIGLTNNLNYNVLDVYVITLSIIKLFLALFTFSLINLYILLKFKNNFIAIVSSFIYIVLLYAFSRASCYGFMQFINIANHTYLFSCFDNIWISAWISLSYYIIVLSLLSILLNRVINKVDLLEMRHL